MGIYVWGTGCGAGELIELGLKPERITAFIDNAPCSDTFLDRPVIFPAQFDHNDCSLLIITTRHADAIMEQCHQLGIPDSKLFYLKNSCQLIDRNRSCLSARDVLGQELYEALQPTHRLIPVPPQLSHSCLPERAQTNDYVRLATLELLCRRLDGVSGAAAELGVYKGGFARCINHLLPERTLYLFDSFMGFDPEEGQRETAAGHCTEAFLAAHQNTTATTVLRSMPHPSNVIMRPGYFPATTEGLENETYCLVSLDVDFENTTYEGLRYFWPRLSPGGYLLLHDWNNPKLPGVSSALARFETELGAVLPSVPLPDANGTLVFFKPYKKLIF